MARKKLESSISHLTALVKFNEVDLEEKFVQQEKEYVLRSHQTQREINSKLMLKHYSKYGRVDSINTSFNLIIVENVDILKQSYADETENVIDRVSKIHTRENMRLRRKLTKENKKSLAIMDENTKLKDSLRKNEIENSIFLGELNVLP